MDEDDTDEDDTLDALDRLLEDDDDMLDRLLADDVEECLFIVLDELTELVELSPILSPHKLCSIAAYGLFSTSPCSVSNPLLLTFDYPYLTSTLSSPVPEIR